MLENDYMIYYVIIEKIFPVLECCLPMENKKNFKTATRHREKQSWLYTVVNQFSITVKHSSMTCALYIVHNCSCLD